MNPKLISRIVTLIVEFQGIGVEEFIVSNKVPRPNSPRCTYYHQIEHQINECPFIENNVRQGFIEKFQNLNPKPTKVGNHGPIELENLYHERVKILDRFREQIWRNNIVKMKAWTRVV